MYASCAGVPGSGHASLSGVTGYPANVGIVLPRAAELGNIDVTPDGGDTHGNALEVGQVELYQTAYTVGG